MRIQFGAPWFSDNIKSGSMSELPEETMTANPDDNAPSVAPELPARKPRPNHQRTLQILRAMSPQEKLAQVFKLNERTLNLMRIGLRRRFPDLDDEAFEKLYLQMRERCHNRNY